MGRGGVWKKHKDIEFLSNTGPNNLRNHKATKSLSIQCWGIIGQLLLLFGSFLPSSIHKQSNKKRCQGQRWIPPSRLTNCMDPRMYCNVNNYQSIMYLVYQESITYFVEASMHSYLETVNNICTKPNKTLCFLKSNLRQLIRAGASSPGACQFYLGSMHNVWFIRRD